MKTYLVITGDNCPYCDKAKALITERGDRFVEMPLIDAVEPMSKLGVKTVPQVFELVGGYEDLARES